MSDNGASREGGTHGAVDCNWPYSGMTEPVERQVERLSLLGGREAPAHYPEGWANVGNTPFRKYKQYVDLGGVRSPLIVSWPQPPSDAGAVRRQFVHVIDVMPTILEAVGIEAPDRVDGASFGASVASATAPDARTVQYWEMLGHRAVWREGMKAVTTHEPGTDYAEDQWRLYDTYADPSEAHDIAAEKPDLLEQLVALWWEEAGRNDVFPLDDRPLVQLLDLRSPFGQTARRTIELPAGVGHIPFSTGSPAPSDPSS